MGLVTWLAGGFAAVLIARIVPSPAKRGLRGDAFVAITALLAAGVIATALDFGGWNEPDWRAAVFAGLAALAALGARRLFLNDE